jgi:hypothetical protein
MEKLVRSHVERCLEDIWDACRVYCDEDGDYPFRAGIAACWVRVESCRPHLVRVFGHVVTGVKGSPALLREINEVNCRADSVFVAWDRTDRLVRVTTTIHPQALDRESLEHALDAVHAVANDIGPLVAAVHGGATPFESQDTGSEAAEEE